MHMRQHIIWTRAKLIFVFSLVVLWVDLLLQRRWRAITHRVGANGKTSAANGGRRISAGLPRTVGGASPPGYQRRVETRR
jgi:hypothetical protein